MNILVPRNLDNRAEKLRQNNFNLLQEEVIQENLYIDNTWNFSTDEVKTRIINGNLFYYNNHKWTYKCTEKDRFPEWFINLTVNGNLKCGEFTLLYDFKNMPFVKGHIYYNHKHGIMF